MDDSDQNDKNNMVRHPWGVSRPWTVDRYTPQGWLAGTPRRPNWPAMAPLERTPGIVLPHLPQTTVRSATNLAAPTNLVEKEKNNTDHWRILHVSAFVILAVSSFGSMLLSYKMYKDKNNNKTNLVKSVKNNLQAVLEPKKLKKAQREALLSLYLNSDKQPDKILSYESFADLLHGEYIQLNEYGDEYELTDIGLNIALEELKLKEQQKIKRRNYSRGRASVMSSVGMKKTKYGGYE